MDFTQIQSWRDLASAHTIGEIRGIADEVNREANSKSDRLRSLIGARFRDLLKTADTVTAMESSVEKHSTALTDIYTSKKKLQLKRLIDNVHGFNSSDKNGDISSIACKALFKQAEFHVRYQLNHPITYTNISRTLYLGKLAVNESTHFEKRQANLHSLFIDALRTELLEAVTFRPEKAFDLMLAYTILEQCSPEEGFQKLLNYRLSLIQKTLDRKTPSSLMDALRLISSSLYLFEICFKRNQLRKSMEQQSTAHLLLEHPDISKNIDIDLIKVIHWLPETIKKASCIPEPCIKSFQSSFEPENYMKKMKKSFLDSLNSHIHESLNTLRDPSDMIEFYKNVILLFKESILLRSLSDDAGSWLFSVFHNEWSSRFSEVFRSETNENESMKNELNNIYEQLTKGTVECKTSESFFENENLLNSIYSGKDDSLKELYSTVNRFRKAATGNVQGFSQLLDEWCEKVSFWKSQIDDTKALQNLIISVHSDVVDSNHEEDYLDMNDDYEKYQKWKEIGTKKVTEFVEYMGKEGKNQLQKTYDDLVDCLHGLMLKNDINAHCIVYCIRAVEILSASLLPFEQISITEQKKDINTGFKKLADLLDYSIVETKINDYESPDLRTWTNSEGLSYPTRPSLAILGKMMNFNEYLVNLFGYDSMIWTKCCDELDLLRKKTGMIFRNNLQTLLSTLSTENDENDETDETNRNRALQIYFDIYYLNGYFLDESCDEIKRIPALKNIPSTILQHMESRANDIITSTQVIYHALELSKK